MKKLGLITFSLLFVASVAQADSVSITVQASATPSNNPNGSGTVSWGWTPTGSPTAVKFAGKTCNWVSSTTGAGTAGCNYSITVAPDGSLSNPGSNSSGCTPPAQMIAACQ
jgi:hypothetical protein